MLSKKSLEIIVLSLSSRMSYARLTTSVFTAYQQVPLNLKRAIARESAKDPTNPRSLHFRFNVQPPGLALHGLGSRLWSLVLGC